MLISYFNSGFSGWQTAKKKGEEGEEKKKRKEGDPSPAALKAQVGGKEKRGN